MNLVALLSPSVSSGAVPPVAAGQAPAVAGFAEALQQVMQALAGQGQGQAQAPAEVSAEEPVAELFAALEALETGLSDDLAAAVTPEQAEAVLAEGLEALAGLIAAFDTETGAGLLGQVRAALAGALEPGSAESAPTLPDLFEQVRALAAPEQTMARAAPEQTMARAAPEQAVARAAPPRAEAVQPVATDIPASSVLQQEPETAPAPPAGETAQPLAAPGQGRQDAVPEQALMTRTAPSNEAIRLSPAVGEVRPPGAPEQPTTPAATQRIEVSQALAAPDLKAAPKLPAGPRLVEIAVTALANAAPEAAAEPAALPATESAPRPAAPAAATPAAPPAPPEAAPFTRKIAAQIQQVGVGEGRTVVQLRPDGLGQIEVELMRTEEGALRVVMKVENPGVLQALRTDRDTLLGLLGAAGSDLGAGDLEFGTFERGGQRQQQDAPETALAASGDPEPDQQSDDRPILGDGRVDIIT
ncbi:RNA polymerase sigma factor [Oceanicola granulosus HTCC2516]|uniref:RNA polymerase sigma factor n=1 Tax=Oceanicola granulosus (strain ATCC BAA-861 / DSM 15982 / KCTC 12143 / HTCC2516) TaxID=314256 RepID=Q2CGF7_OCEGH|nr:flagellar hook-length control protein FliK [Oceanicola granulosus]EAR51761.1 RNA polymerase sigma factor [Oceanicola granulosus HTCC2516]